mmetsp:Transcript_33946/g.96175  ORF Transcript_33946/g.96175 Transcript_33946/m.96175 type:complete len:209 (-) Transcript_33946:124-750(-)
MLMSRKGSWVTDSKPQPSHFTVDASVPPKTAWMKEGSFASSPSCSSSPSSPPSSAFISASSLMGGMLDRPSNVSRREPTGLCLLEMLADTVRLSSCAAVCSAIKLAGVEASPRRGSPVVAAGAVRDLFNTFRLALRARAAMLARPAAPGSWVAASSSSSSSLFFLPAFFHTRPPIPSSLSSSANTGSDGGRWESSLSSSAKMGSEGGR